MKKVHIDIAHLHGGNGEQISAGVISGTITVEDDDSGEVTEPVPFRIQGKVGMPETSKTENRDGNYRHTVEIG